MELRARYLLSNILSPYLAGTQKSLPFATSIEPVQPVHPCSLTRLYTAGWPNTKLIMDSSKNGNWASQFKKFSRQRLNAWLVTFCFVLAKFLFWYQSSAARVNVGSKNSKLYVVIIIFLACGQSYLLKWIFCLACSSADHLFWWAVMTFFFLFQYLYLYIICLCFSVSMLLFL